MRLSKVEISPSKKGSQDFFPPFEGGKTCKLDPAHPPWLLRSAFTTDCCWQRVTCHSTWHSETKEIRLRSSTVWQNWSPLHDDKRKCRSETPQNPFPATVVSWTMSSLKCLHVSEGSYMIQETKLRICMDIRWWRIRFSEHCCLFNQHSDSKWKNKECSENKISFPFSVIKH